ncbi:TonB-dependent siderophore receptor [Epibacterium sp. Ofav1-8]|uniref:TonB-dependent siderophore receptor n=1 Tax=Epibacterium sp. Ofav1-8 TaxID=2917735 RepID=UPI001EF73299|nr:TonB-dependent siderophore receptor [Epibacterium sp. Ofav1-8]MCG7621809.1 TonB-dependent siderophore receptor [Epibacterium sp. Ofav1-8]
MHLRTTPVSILALMAALPAAAQVIELQPIHVTDGDTQAFFGDSVATETGTVAKTGDAIIETPRAVHIVTAQQIAERGATNVEQALQYASGITAGQWGLDNRSDWSLVRGFAPTTLHDGLNARYGYYNDTKPEPFLLNSVEVLKGPVSGLYGSGSVGGVVNTTSKTAAQDSDNLWQLSVGSNQRAQIAGDVSGTLNPSGTLRYRLVGLLRNAETPVDFSQDDSFAFAPSITWRPNDDTELTVLANYQKTDGSPLIQFASLYGTLEPATGFGNGTFFDDSLFVGEPGFDTFESEQRGITAMFRHRFNDVWSMNANARYLEGEALYQHAWWAFDNVTTGRYNPDGTVNRTFYRAENEMKTAALDAYATARYTLGRVNMRSIIGASYSRGYYDSDTGYGAQVAPIDPFNPTYAGYPNITVTDSDGTAITEWGVYLQNRAVVDDRLFVDFGLRYGHIETGASTGSFGATSVAADDSAWTGNIAMLYRFDNGIAPYISYSESFRQDEVGTDVNGTPFEPTEGTQYEIGVKYQPAGSDTLFVASVFDLTKSNMTVSDPANPGFSIQTGEATSRGLELELFHRLGDVSFDAAYTYLDTENSSGAQIAQVPENAASLWVNYEPTAGQLQGWKFGAGVRYTGASWGGSDTYETPSYTLYDAAVTYSRDNWQVALNVQNLLDENYVTTCQSGACYLGEGRNVALTLTSKF